MVRAVPVKLDVTESDTEPLERTINQFQFAANYVVRNCREDPDDPNSYVLTNRGDLHARTYAAVRERTDLYANLVQAARRYAGRALDRVTDEWSAGREVSLPTFTSRLLDYDKRSATFHSDHASLSTVSGRVCVEYVLPEAPEGTPHERWLFDENREIAGATFHEYGGDYYLHLRTKSVVDDAEPTEDTPGRNGTILGVDLGVENIAVTSTGMFWDAAELQHWHRGYENRRGSLAQTGRRWAHENVQHVGRKETNRFEQMLHRVANGILAEADVKGCSAIAFEDLTDVRERMPSVEKFHAWAFRKLYSYVEYKAKDRGIDVDQIPPRNTSRRCSTCGFTHEANRDGETFRCQKCEYENHADYNAAKNIEMNYLRRHRNRDAIPVGSRERSSRERPRNGADGGAPIGVRLNGGMLSGKDIKPLPTTSVG
jgi:IS605 OrfB family transposase